MELSQQDIDIVKLTAPVLVEVGGEITTTMYQILFNRHPEVRQIFDDADNQPAKLASAIVAYAKNIDNLEVLESAVAKISQSHTAAGVTPYHYPLVADALITAIGDVLGDAATDDVVRAWTNAFNFLANTLMDQEAQLAAQQQLAKSA